VINNLECHRGRNESEAVHDAIARSRNHGQDSGSDERQHQHHSQGG
jgi:hypothetical protein